jgi:hypothetical protein
MQRALIFWPLHPLVQHVVAMFHPVCFCAVGDGWYGRLDLRREGVGGILAVTPVAVEVWMSSWNDRGHVRSERGSCSLCTVTSVPSAGVGVVVGAPRGSPSCQRAPHVPRTRQKYAKRIGRSRAYVAGVGRGGNRSRQGAGVRRFDNVMGARARQKASPSLRRFSS